ncbi:terpene synthase family protein [Nocardia acidivorans]|uniref:terpene synthase family protein n=1 Tax=Nocardia acidivorans TaxID=404580 RepID=UPI000A99F76B|nr:terpene synthase family protein [Nocardia acidivorans]
MDDYYPAVFFPTRNLIAAKVQGRRLQEFMPIDEPVTATPANPLELGLLDLWTRTTAAMDTDHRHEFRRAVQSFLTACEWEVLNHTLHRIPDPIDYVEMRRDTFGSDLTKALSRPPHGNLVPPQIYRTQTLANLENTAADYAILLNDLFSYQKETEFEGDFHNGVSVIRNFLDCDRDRAVTLVNDLMTARMQQFEHVVAVELPTLYEEYDLDESVRDVLNQRAAELQGRMAAILNWHMNCRRYRESHLLHRFRPQPPIPASLPTLPFLRPTGLGTHGLRIAPPRTASQITSG